MGASLLALAKSIFYNMNSVWGSSTPKTAFKNFFSRLIRSKLMFSSKVNRLAFHIIWHPIYLYSTGLFYHYRNEAFRNWQEMHAQKDICLI